ncbi:alpha/beta hydrolase [candidate division CSSED10-310 bacterium]|uniref:Alpha/beta hydrolase n=1 Tax=candidate division CSSED10-310 bacterium TaxID=2855610 RepID=A0ABV6YWU5_UNCC1
MNSQIKRALLVLIVLLNSITLGCDKSDDENADFQLEITWDTCSLYYGANDGRAECAAVQMPLFYDRDDERTIPVYVKRLRAPEQTTGQLWLLHGGPGASGVEDFGHWMDELSTLTSGLDIYTLDHRGVGQSDRLGCPEQEDPSSEWGTTVSDNEIAACIEYMNNHWGDALNGFTTTAAARDVGELINHLKTEGQQIYIWGGSYGSYLAHRYMQQFPAQADGVILEGIAPADSSFADYDYYFNLNAQKLLDHCGRDDRCSSKLGADPWQVVADLLDLFEAGHCQELNLNRSQLKVVLAGMLFYEGIRELIPALVYRLRRCNQNDQEVYEHLYEMMYGQGGVWGYGPPASSTLLGYHIALSELWDNDDPPSLAEVQARFEAAYIALGTSVRFGKIYDLWPLYQRDTYDDTFAYYDGPLLMLQGGYDPATPIEKAAIVQSIFHQDNQTFVLFPYAAHNINSGTPVYGGGLDCGYQIFLDFLVNPGQELDLNCMEQLKPIDFDGDPNWAYYLMGTTDVWGDGDTRATEKDTDRSPEPSRESLNINSHRFIPHPLTF